MRSGIGFAPARQGNVAVTHTLSNRVGFAQRLGQTPQHPVLLLLERRIVAAFEFDSDREIVAALTRAPLRLPCMPGALETWDILDEFAIAADQKMRGNLQAGYFPEIGVSARVETVREQLVDRCTAEAPRRQADAVNNDKLDAATRRPCIEIRRRNLMRRRQHTGGVDYPVFMVVHIDGRARSLSASN